MSDNSEYVKIKKDALWKYATVILAIVLVVVLIINFSGSGSTVNGNAVNNGAVVPGDSGNVQVGVDDDAILGDPNAPVTIIEFSDYQCPFCRKFWTDTLPLIKEQYIDTGKVRFVYRDFPLSSIHPAAQIAGEAAECVRDVAGNDAAYYEMHDKIYEEQNIMDGGSPTAPVTKTVVFDESDLVGWADELGYDIQSCLDSGKFSNEIQDDLADGMAAGGQGTPYFVINGKSLSGAQPFSAFREVIEAELN